MFTVIIVTTSVVPQPFEIMYDTGVKPAPIPVTIPVEPTVATVVNAELHEPPLTVAVNVVVSPGHITPRPLNVPAEGIGSIVIVNVERVVPQPFDIVYDILVVPAERPVTIPDELITATDRLLLLQPPPVVVLVIGVVAPIQIWSSPDNVPALGSGFIVSAIVEYALPQLLVTV